ncbi:MAG TPA: hypothetical protein VHA78_03815 [Candidatus Peribacteraceae bacterium]|nr:hypothetical protein [Candidatus Peribacteraceae bacterium]
MPRKATTLNEAATSEAVMPTPAPVTRRTDSSPTADEKLDQIVEYLRQMNNRDRLRTIGGTFRGLLALIPLLIFLWSVWYFYLHGTEIIKMITDESVKSAATYSQQGLMDQMTQYLQQQQQKK